MALGLVPLWKMLVNIPRCLILSPLEPSLSYFMGQRTATWFVTSTKKTDWIDCMQAVPSKKELNSVIWTINLINQSKVHFGSNVNLCPHNIGYAGKASTNVTNTFLPELLHMALELYFLCGSQVLTYSSPPNTVTFTLEMLIRDLKVFKQTVIG